MYLKYLGLEEKPFSISPDPDFLYMSEFHREALAHLLYGISNDGCLILLTGEVGTGKTTVCRCLLEQLTDSTDVALILNPRLSVIDLLATICDELEIPDDDDDKSVKTYIDKLNKHLLVSHAKHRNVALIIDEAQNLSIDVLEQLRLLTNLETNKQKLLKIILLGQPELKKMLESPEVSQINQRITSRYHLLPLNRDDVFSYVHHRLAVVGGSERLFSDAAINQIYKLSHGIPRLINILCDRALLGAYVESKRQVNVKTVNKAAGEVLAEVEPDSERKNRAGTGWLLPFLLLILGALATYLYLNDPLYMDTLQAIRR